MRRSFTLVLQMLCYTNIRIVSHEVKRGKLTRFARAELIHPSPQTREECLASSSGRTGKVVCTSARISLLKG
jgi:hypothetical protein